jgi:hypothetical protein
MISTVSDDLHTHLNNAIGAVAAMASVLRTIAAQSGEPEIAALAAQTLNSPTVTAALEQLGEGCVVEPE